MASTGGPRLGADPDELERLASGLRTAAERLTAVGARVAGTLRRAPWEGPDAEAFRSRWRHHLAPEVAARAGACRSAARDLDRHASEQRRASTAAGTAGPSAGTARAGSGRPAHLPRRIEVLGARLDGSYLLGAGGLGTTATIEHLPAGRLRVTVADARAVGAQAGAGRSAAVSTPGGTSVSGGSAAVGGRVESLDSRTWTIEEEHLPFLLAAAGLTAAAPGAATVAGLARGLGLPVPSPGPHPDRTERLVGVGATGNVVAGAGTGPSVALTAGVTLLAGTAEGPAGPSAVVQWSESGEAVLGRRLAGAVGLRTPVARGDLTVRLEVPTGRVAGTRPLELTMERTAGDLRTVTRTRVDPAATPGLAASLRRTAELLARGDVEGAGERLAATTASVAATGTTVDHFRIGRSGLTLPVSGGAVSITPGVQRVQLRRTTG